MAVRVYIFVFCYYDHSAIKIVLSIERTKVSTNMKCLCLSSRGLDSLLAVEIMKQQGIDTKIVEFKTPFFGYEDGIDISKDFITMLKNPKFGYGKNLNPCIDCKILMLKKAREILEKEQAYFLATGEVVGQRPMSQNKQTLLKMDKEAKIEGLVVRPLSAKLLPETIPEKEKWIDRNKLYEISGRSRKDQMDLANKFGIQEYPTPAGGCLLTDAGFSMRMVQLMKIHSEFSANDVEFIKHGRMFAVGDGVLIVGRNKEENYRLMDSQSEHDVIFDYTSSPGPFALLRFDDSFSARLEADKIVRKYIK